jgi:hypothetical protein
MKDALTFSLYLFPCGCGCVFSSLFPLSFSLPYEDHYHSSSLTDLELAQGFSWSSLDYDGNWKLLQYTTKRYFAPFIVSGAKNDSVVTAYVTTDTMKPLGGTPPLVSAPKS